MAKRAARATTPSIEAAAVKPRHVDGVLAVSADGLICRMFAPPRWAFWRWIRWALLPLALCRIERRGGIVVRLIVEGERAS